jgi:hypothetical protein
LRSDWSGAACLCAPPLALRLAQFGGGRPAGLWPGASAGWPCLAHAPRRRRKSSQRQALLPCPARGADHPVVLRGRPGWRRTLPSEAGCSWERAPTCTAVSWPPGPPTTSRNASSKPSRHTPLPKKRNTFGLTWIGLQAGSLSESSGTRGKEACLSSVGVGVEEKRGRLRGIRVGPDNRGGVGPEMALCVCLPASARRTSFMPPMLWASG